MKLTFEREELRNLNDFAYSLIASAGILFALSGFLPTPAVVSIVIILQASRLL